MDAAGNQILSQLYAKLPARQVLVGVEAVVQPSRRRGVLVEHQRILQALLAGDEDGSHAMIMAHLGATHALVRPSH